MTDNQHLYAVLLAGGGGTRLWPKSRGKTPKQFLKLTSEKTMMQIAAQRINQIVEWERVIVVTNQKYVAEIKAQLPKVLPENIIAEPAKKDTALAMLVGALFAKSKDENAVVINSASDHIVSDVNEFVRVMNRATEIASEEPYLVTVGITPQYPTSAFGYIKVGSEIKKLDRNLNLFKVDNFTEKPNLPTAIAFISTGKYFWNANMYVWSAKQLQAAFKKHMPAMFQLTADLDKKNAQDFHRALPAIYQAAEGISIDYAISEKADNLVLIPGDFGWNDVGDWKVVYELGEKDENNNVIMSDDGQDLKALVINSRHNLIHTNNRLVAINGLKDMIIVDTDEILMICPKSKSQEVKELVNQLKAAKKNDYL